MSIPRRHPYVEVGDTGGHYTAWRVCGISDRVSDRGALYPSFAPDPGGVKMSVFADYDRTILVAEGVGAVGSRVVAAPVVVGTTSSGLTVSAVVASSSATSLVVLWVQLASEADLREAEDDAEAFRLTDPPELNLNSVLLRTMRQFYLNIQADFPTPQRCPDPLTFLGANDGIVAGRRGLPDTDSYYLYGLNPEGDWELDGLQNISDYKEWAIAWSLHLLWKRKAGSFEDPMFQRSQTYKAEAREQWKLLSPQIDRTRDGVPERQLRRRTPIIRRG